MIRPRQRPNRPDSGGGEPETEDQYWQAQEQEILNQRGAEQFKRGMKSREDMPGADRHGNPAYADINPFDYGNGQGPVRSPDPKQEAFIDRLIKEVGSYDSVAELYPDDDPQSQYVKSQSPRVLWEAYPVR